MEKHIDDYAKEAYKKLIIISAERYDLEEARRKDFKDMMNDPTRIAKTIKFRRYVN